MVVIVSVLGRPFASEDLRTLLSYFVRVFNSTGDSNVDIKHNITQFESMVLSGARSDLPRAWAFGTQRRRRPRQL